MLHAPLPDFGDVVRCIAGRPAADAVLARPWVRGDSEKAFWFSRSAWSLCAIAELRKRVTAGSSVRAWFPAYFCNESLGPLRDLGVRLDFYPVLFDGSADLVACGAMLESATPDLVVAVHYFGQPVALDGLARLSAAAGAWLVEDAVHALRPVRGIGECGDFVLYSPHKLLPIPDGALLLVREIGPARVTRELLEDNDFAGLCGSMVAGRQTPARSTYGWLAKRLMQQLGVRAGRGTGPGFHGDDGMSPSAYIGPGMSVLARRLLGTMLGRLDEEEAVRKANAAAWLSHLKPIGVFPDGTEFLPSPETPYLAGVGLPGPTAAERVYDQLRRSGVAVTTWPDLPPEVSADPARQRVAIAMRKTRVFLPVHRSIHASSLPSVFADDPR